MQEPASGVTHDVERRRFVISIAGGDRSGFLDYRPIGDDAWDLTYTYVPRQDRGGGIGRDLVLHVLDLARERGLKVVPTCGFVATVIDEHPDYQDLLLRETR
jgi:predicted GNAT family acetyltransferase